MSHNALLKLLVKFSIDMTLNEHDIRLYQSHIREN
jgi:hypothetical protein